MTENGEIGIDPTAVNVNINLSLQLKTDEAANDEVASRANAETGYRHRIIVDAYLNRILSKRQVVYKELTETIAAATANAVILFARLISFPLLSF